MNGATNLQQEITLRKQQLDQKDTHIQRLEELIKQFRRKHFSPSSEKLSPDQINLFNEAEEEAVKESESEQQPGVEVKSHTRKKKPRVSIPRRIEASIKYDSPDQRLAVRQQQAKPSANLYGLIVTAKANGFHTYDYFRHVFAALPNAESVEDVEKLLPWNIKLDPATK